MKTYSLATVPTCAGVYYLTNKRTGEIYVGQSLSLNRRHREWKAALISGFGHTNIDMHNAMKRNPDVDEWFFVVVAEMPGANTQALLAAEANEIARLQKSVPGKILNTTPVPGQFVSAGVITILTNEGAVVSHARAATMLHRNVDTIRDKVRWLRDQGMSEVKLDDLTMDRREILKKYKTP